MVKSSRFFILIQNPSQLLRFCHWDVSSHEKICITLRSQNYRFLEFLNKILPNGRDKNKIWHCVLANVQNAVHVQFRASS